MNRCYGHAARRATRLRSRRCAFESLESRIALSGTPPTVVDVVVSSTEWSPSFISYLESHSLGSGGYSIPVGSSTQTAPLPWNNLDQVKIRFSEDVHIQAADLALTGKNVNSYAFEHFAYNPQTQTATWTLAAPIAADRLMIDLDANGIDPVQDLDGNVLDGEWTNGVSTYASGNGAAGGDFEFRLNVLPGDVNQSGAVNYADYSSTRSLEGKGVGDAGYNPKYDVDGSGLINTSDSQNVMAELWDTLPSGNPAGLNNDAPTTRGFESVYINNHAVDVAISLWSAYDDAESGASGLTYSIKSNSAPSLFDAMSINQSTGTLTVSSAQGASGRSTITISATDVGGISTDATLYIDVYYVNQPPTISDFVPESLPGNYWFFSGLVTDPDDDVTDWIVSLFGVFSTRAAVGPDGYFEITVSLDEDDWGSEYAITFDPHGLQSNVPDVFIGLT